MNFLLIPNLILSLLKVFYLYFKQIPFPGTNSKEIPRHIVLEVEREYRHKNYFKFYNEQRKKDFLLFNVFKVNEFTKIRKVSIKKLLYFFVANSKLLTKREETNSQLRNLIGRNPSTSLATYCYFCGLFDEIKLIQPDSLIFHGGAALAAKAAKQQNLKTFWLSHGIVNPSNLAIRDSDVIYVYSEDEKNFLEDKSVGSEIKLYPIKTIKSRSKTIIIFLDGNRTKEEEGVLMQVIEIFKTHDYRIIFKTHPTFLTIKEPDLYLRLRSAFSKKYFLTNDIDTEDLLSKEKPNFIVTWVSTAACISLRSGIIPISVELNENADAFSEPYPFKKRTIYWKEESSRLTEILFNPEEYQKNLDLLKSR